MYDLKGFLDVYRAALLVVLAEEKRDHFHARVSYAQGILHGARSLQILSAEQYDNLYRLMEQCRRQGYSRFNAPLFSIKESAA